MFVEASEEGANVVKRIVKEYEGVSTQLVNFDKSLIYFSGNVSIGMRDQIGRPLGVKIPDNPETYLGLPTMVGRWKRWKRDVFVGLKEKIIRRMKT